MALNVSVIIPCRNMGDTLERAVESALAADATQVVIVDDQSTDNTESVCIELESKYANVVSFPTSTMFAAGVCYARNLGIVFADYDWIVPLDADDTLQPGSLRRMRFAWQPNTVVYGGWSEKTPDETVTIFDAPPPGMLARKNLCHATYLFHSKNWLNVGGYDPAFEIGGEDYALMCALVQGGCKLKRLDGEPLYTRTIAENVRTAGAIGYWDTIQKLAKERYPLVFHGQPQTT